VSSRQVFGTAGDWVSIHEYLQQSHQPQVPVRAMLCVYALLCVVLRARVCRSARTCVCACSHALVQKVDAWLYSKDTDIWKQGLLSQYSVPALLRVCWVCSGQGSGQGLALIVRG
jgi:hypothetical protein